MRKELTLSRLRSAGRVVYNKKSIQLADRIKKLFTSSQNLEAFQGIPPKLRFQCFYIWYAYFRMLPPHFFVEILNNLNLNNSDRSVTKKNSSKRSLRGGLFGITISAIVAGIAAAASKAAVTMAAAATAIGSSTAASTIATSVAGGVAGVLATKATEAIIEEAT